MIEDVLESIVACVKVRCWANAPLAGGMYSRTLHHVVAIFQRRFAPRCASTNPLLAATVPAEEIALVVCASSKVKCT
jgi:hypothetical protein